MPLPYRQYVGVTLNVDGGASFPAINDPPVVFQQTRVDGPYVSVAENYEVAVSKAAISLRDVPLAIVPVTLAGDDSGNQLSPWLITIDLFTDRVNFINGGFANSIGTVTLPIVWQTQDDVGLPPLAGNGSQDNQGSSYWLRDVATFVALFNETLQAAVAGMDSIAYADLSGGYYSSTTVTPPPLLRYDPVSRGFTFYIPDVSGSTTESYYLLNTPKGTAFYAISFNTPLASILSGFRGQYSVADPVRNFTLLASYDPYDSTGGGSAGTSAFIAALTSGMGAGTSQIDGIMLGAGSQRYAMMRQERGSIDGLCNVRSVVVTSDMPINSEKLNTPQGWGNITQPSGSGGERQGTILQEFLLRAGDRDTLLFEPSDGAMRWHDLGGGGDLREVTLQLNVCTTDGTLYPMYVPNFAAAYLQLCFKRRDA